MFEHRATETNVFIYGCYMFSRMETDTVEAAAVGTNTEVMAAVESGQTERFVLADITCDGAYISIPLREAASLPAWR